MYVLCRECVAVVMSWRTSFRPVAAQSAFLVRRAEIFVHLAQTVLQVLRVQLRQTGGLDQRRHVLMEHRELCEPLMLAPLLPCRSAEHPIQAARAARPHDRERVPVRGLA